MQHTFLQSPKYILVTILVATTFLISCSDKIEYNMELAFQREMTAQAIYENDRILQRIEKEVADNGKKAADVAVLDHAEHIVHVRNKNIDSLEFLYKLIDNIKPTLQQAGTEDGNALTLLHFYQTEYKANKDSLTFQKFLNVYLTFERSALNDELAKVSGSCNWGTGFTPHVFKTTDTISLGLNYELQVVPEIFNYKTTYISDTCDITIYKNDVPVEMKYTVVRKGFVYLIAVTPGEPGNYKVHGTFAQRTLNHSYAVKNVFTDRFVVE